MFVVLGAIVLVTLFGYVGLTLAGKDQTLSGDLNDIKSRDEVAIAGLQLAVNRLVANPADMIAVLNSFIQEGRTSHSSPSKTWFDFTNPALTLQASEPSSFFSLTSNPGDQSGVKVEILGIAQGDTSAIPAEFKDSSAVYVSFRCKASGRHGDQKLVQATYRIHGVSLAYSATLRSYVIPNYALYLGAGLQTNNMAITTVGDVYVAGSGGTFFNSGAPAVIQGDFKWDDDLSLNSKVVVTGNAYVNGAVYSNSGGNIQVNGNFGIANGFKAMANDDTISTTGNLWIGGMDPSGDWHSFPIHAGGSMVLRGGNVKPVQGKVVVGKSLWLPDGMNQTGGDSLYVGNRLYIGDPASNVNASTSATRFHVDSSLIMTGTGTLTSTSTSVAVRESLQVQGTVTSGPIRVGVWSGVGSLGSTTLQSWTGGSGPTNNSPGTIHWVAAPTPLQLGIPDSLRMTSVAQNPMDSVLVDMTHSPEVTSKLVDFNSTLLSNAHAPSTDRITAEGLDSVYQYLTRTNRTYNGYMCLKYSNGSSVTNYSDVANKGFHGKMIMIVEGQYSVNSEWPHSATKSNIQVIALRNGGSLGQWGWKHGNFAGIFYWENPPCGNHTIKIDTTTDTLYGSIIIGNHVPASACAATVTPNSGSVVIIKDPDIFGDIGVNLPGVLVPGKDGNGHPIGRVTQRAVSANSPLLRLVHDQPYFEPIGVFR